MSNVRVCRSLSVVIVAGGDGGGMLEEELELELRWCSGVTKASVWASKTNPRALRARVTCERAFDGTRM